MRCSVHLEHTRSPPCLLILPEVHKLQEMMGTAPGHGFWVRFSNLCSLCRWCSRGCPESTGGPVMVLAVSPLLVCWAITSGFSLWICVSWCCFWHCCSKCAALVHMLSLCWRGPGSVCVSQEDGFDGMYFKEENVEDSPREIRVSVCKLSVVSSILSN